MTTKMLPLAELSVTAIEVLCREIGPANTARFIRQFGAGFGNYSDERDRLFGDLTVKELAAEIKAARTRDEH